MTCVQDLVAMNFIAPVGLVKTDQYIMLVKCVPKPILTQHLEVLLQED